MEVDLHTHSIYSDGEHTPSELLFMAKEKGLKYIALTDHDTIDGVKELINSDHDNITVYSGVELSADYHNGQMHILGYNFDIENPRLNSVLDKLKEDSITNINGYINELKERYNIILPKEDLDELFQSSNIHRPQLALLLVKNGYCNSVPEAFDKYLKDSKVTKTVTDMAKEECLSLIKEAGGISVLAHPWSLKLSNSELKKEVEYLVSKGLNGIEIYHSGTSKSQTDFYKNLAREFDLITTGGSDYHGEKVKPDISLGSGRNNLNINNQDINFLKKIVSRY